MNQARTLPTECNHRVVVSLRALCLQEKAAHVVIPKWRGLPQTTGDNDLNTAVRTTNIIDARGRVTGQATR
jgi:hypothetical protein